MRPINQICFKFTEADADKLFDEKICPKCSSKDVARFLIDSELEVMHLVCAKCHHCGYERVFDPMFVAAHFMEQWLR